MTFLLDDDPLIHMTWRMAARQAGAELEIFDSVEALLARLEGADPGTRIYLDSKLKGGAKGEEVARQVIERGFREVYLTTGYPPERFRHATWLKGVIGKDPPFSYPRK